MPDRGPRPKRVLSSATKTKARESEYVHVAADGQVRGPDLPDGDWPDATRAWWEAWRVSAQAQAFTDVEWHYLLDTALLHRALWLGDTRVAGELRLRLARFGATEVDRDRMRLQVDPPNPARDRQQRRAHVLALASEQDERTT